MATQPELIIPVESGSNHKEPQALTVQTMHPLTLLDKAIERGVPAETLEKLMQMALQWDANEARKAFVAALNNFKANPPVIDKNKHVSYSNANGSVTKYNHATLDHILGIVCPALSEHGLSHRWKTTQSEGKIRVSCVLTHAQGHSEETILEGAADTSGGKNAIQGIGSAVTYLERYTLLAAVGLAAQDQDDDGQAADAPRMENLMEHLEYIANSKDPKELNRLATIARRAADDLKDSRSYVEIVIAENRKALGFCRTLEEMRQVAKPHFEKLRALNHKDGMSKLTADVEAAKKRASA